MTKHYKVTVNGSVYDVTLETDVAAAPAPAAAPAAGTQISSPLPGTCLLYTSRCV